QAEDGIRDRNVTGVQTCALPISSTMISYINRDELEHGRFIGELFRAILSEHPEENTPEFTDWVYDHFRESVDLEIEWSSYVLERSEERRVGKECRMVCVV